MWPNPQFFDDLVTFTEEIFYRKLHFLCSDDYSWDSLSWFIIIMIQKVSNMEELFQLNSHVVCTSLSLIRGSFTLELWEFCERKN